MMRILRPFLAIAIILLSGNQLKAQLVNCNAFLKGKYVEAGINWSGAFGSSVRPPAGYHPDTLANLYNSPDCGGSAASDSSIGFVADPDQDGWATGSPAYFGDFVLPGTPQEGWSLMADGVQYNGWSQVAAGADSIVGFSSCSNQEWSDTSGIQYTKWQGVTNGTYITQFTSLDTNKLYVTVDVLIENTSLAPVNDVYYMRTINPHNDELLSHNPATVNRINYQLPNDDGKTVVSAHGTLHNNAYIFMSTIDDRAKGFINKTPGMPTANTIDNIYAGDGANFYYNTSDSTTMNSSIGLVFSIGTLVSGGGAEFKFAYGFSPALVDSVLDTTTYVHSYSLQAKEYTAYPNPATQAFKIKGVEPNDIVILYSLVGNKVAEYKGAASYVLDGFSAGMYIAVVMGKDGAVRGRCKVHKM